VQETLTANQQTNAEEHVNGRLGDGAEDEVVDGEGVIAAGIVWIGPAQKET